MRQIISSPSFDQKLVKFLKRDPNLEKKVEKVFSLQIYWYSWWSIL